MDGSQVEARVAAGEDAHTELGRFRSFAEKDWLEAACAFANTEGGLIVLGVSDDGTIDGVPMPAEEVHERLTHHLQSSLSAPVRARLGAHEVGSKRIHWVEVSRMRGPEPLRLRGRVLVRRGRASVEAEASELQELYNAFGLILTEERVIPGATVDDLALDAFRAYMLRRGVNLADEPALPIETDLLNREVVDRDLDEVLRPTLYGLMCFGRDPQGHSPTRNFWVDLVAYGGVERGDPVFLSGRATGRLDEQVRRAEGWLKAIPHPEVYDGSVRREGGVVPAAAFREAVVNAVAHRDYAILGSKVLVEVFTDRVVVTSPGALPNHKRPASVIAGGSPRSRNESIAHFLFDMGLMEQRGSGFPRMRAAMRAFNGTEPELEHEPEERWVRVTLRR